LRYHSAFFDLDGTLIDNSEGIRNGFRYALAKLGREGEAGDLPDGIIGPPLRSTFMDLLHMDAAQTEEAVRLYREFYRPVGLFQCTVYPHVEEMLASLKRAGMGVYLATSKARVFAEAILNHTGMIRWFDAVVGSELDGRMDNKAEIVRHLLDAVVPAAGLPAVMVGDRSHDAVGAAACGVDTAAALWGFGTADEFRPCANVRGMFRDAAELCAWLMED
jgi:phosphoglycolate phosphatase